MKIDFSYGFFTFRDYWLSKSCKFIDCMRLVSYKGGVDFSPLFFIKKDKRSVRNDLGLNESELWSLLKKNTRNEINKIKKDNLQYFVNKITLDDFVSKYNHFIDIKNLPIARLSHKRLYKYKNNLAFHSVHNGNDWIAIHVYLVFENYSELLYSITNERIENKISGMANKSLHWFDICSFKSNDINVLDWGGIPLDSSLDGISKFKLSFGGDDVIYSEYYSPFYFLADFLRAKYVKFNNKC
ncbi:hypothetical protein LZS85_09365 [Aliivibrio fischeri]|uniref:hypothetical protein n=1 Tax=Aliivibrio fischeri TaxID=668 RepID=UPI001F1F3EB2|nr:hypothetical protein [Aliivibrio fischeri]MCE7566316.1 hypothetical protein [Aliivibrio fischeri]